LTCSRVFLAWKMETMGTVTGAVLGLGEEHGLEV
jgi:hypothetical protein